MVNKKTNLDKMDDALKDNLKDFFCNLCGEYGINNMKAEHYIRLKQILSDVNNIITMKATKAFVKTLKDDKFISNTVYKTILTTVLNTNPNANGYDAQYDGGNGNKKFIAEVKCNIPISKGVLGNNKIDGIKTDIKNLFIGKWKVIKTNNKYYEDYYKFFVVMTCESIEKLKRDNIRDCMDKIINPINATKVYRGKILYYDDLPNKNDLNTDNVYVVFVSID